MHSSMFPSRRVHTLPVMTVVQVYLTRGTLPLASVGIPILFFKVGRVFYNWSTIGLGGDSEEEEEHKEEEREE